MGANVTTNYNYRSSGQFVKRICAGILCAAQNRSIRIGHAGALRCNRRLRWIFSVAYITSVPRMPLVLRFPECRNGERSVEKLFRAATGTLEFDLYAVRIALIAIYHQQ